MLDPAIELLRRGVEALGLPLRSVEVELGPSQVEFTFRPQTGLASADTMILFRSAVKQIARRNGYLASFMCRPALPNVMSSGWHLHQSLIEAKSKRNAFVDPDGLSTVGKYYLGGLLAHARAAAAFTTPTINGYRRYQPYLLAPDRVSWARDNRGTMIRVLGQPGDPRPVWKTGWASLPPIRISTWRRRFIPASTASRAGSIPARPLTRPMKPPLLCCRKI
jgi:glutamine synthetase